MGHLGDNCIFQWLGDYLSLTDPGVVEFFKLFLAILEVLNKGVLDKKIRRETNMWSM